ncbi:MAG TPA: hypothetical protein VMU33_14415 [Burkholderiaceae bacterium]|nr:hypothetical protein [Burkholderiaceae bacterium]
MKRYVAALLACAALAPLAASAHAGVSVVIGLPSIAVALPAPPLPVVVPAPTVAIAPAPWYAPAPIVAPAPAYPATVVRYDAWGRPCDDRWDHGYRWHHHGGYDRDHRGHW